MRDYTDTTKLIAIVRSSIVSVLGLPEDVSEGVFEEVSREVSRER